MAAQVYYVFFCTISAPKVTEGINVIHSEQWFRLSNPIVIKDSAPK